MKMDDEKYYTLNKLRRMIDIYTSKVSNSEKLYRLCELCSNSKTFKRMFLDNSYTLNRESFYRDNLDIVKEMYNYYLRYEQSGLINTVNDYLDYKDYYKCYNYAKFVIEKYVNDKSSYKFSDFLFELGIDNNIFDYCVNVIEELDVSLYNKYLNKKKNSVKEYQDYVYYNISNIINGIKTGKLFDGTKFNKKKFWELVPFKDYKNFDHVLRNYVQSEFKSDYLTLLFYISGFNIEKNLINIKKEKESLKRVLIP